MALPPKEATLLEERTCQKCSWLVIMKPDLQSFVTNAYETMVIAGGCPHCDGNMNRTSFFTQDIQFEIHRGVTQELWCDRNTYITTTEKNRILDENRLKLQVEFLL